MFFLTAHVPAAVRQSPRFFGDGGFECLHLLHSRGLLTTDIGGVWLSLEERGTFFEENFLPVAEVHDADPVLFANLRNRHVLDEVLTQDGNLLLTGLIDTIGHWRYPFSDRQTPAHLSARASRRFKTVRLGDAYDLPFTSDAYHGQAFMRGPEDEGWYERVAGLQA